MPSLEDLTTDQLLAHARQMEGSHELLTQLMNDPESRRAVQGMIKKKNPALAIPEYDTVATIEARLAEESGKREALERTIRDRDVRDRLERQRNGVMSKYNLTEGDMSGVEALMVDKDNPIPTYDAAARVYLASRQTADPTPSSLSPPVFKMPDNDIWGKGIGNKAQLDKIAMEQAFGALNDIRSGKVPGMGPGAGR